MAKQFNWPIAVMPFFTVSTLISLLYIAALLDVLPSCALVLFWGGLLFFLYGIIRFPKNLLAQLSTPGMVCFLVFLIVIQFKVKHAYFSSWDEFSHWGTISKEIFINRGIFIKEIMSTSPDYPPAASMFHYFFYQVTGFSEGITYFAQDFLMLAALTCFFQDIKWRHWLLILPIILMSYCCMMTFGAGLLSVFIDTTLGIFFGMAIVCYVLARQKEAAIIRLVPVIFCLPILKAVGVLLAWIVVIIVLLDYLIRYFGDRTKKRNYWRCSLICLLLPLALLTSTITWNHHVHNMGISKSFKSSVTPEKITNLITGKAETERDKITISAFERALSQRIVGNADGSLLPYFYVHLEPTPLTVLNLGLTLLFFVALGFFGIRDKQSNREFLQCNLLMLMGCVIYFVGLLILYLYSFDAFEGPILASYERYVGIYFLGWSLALYAFFLKNMFIPFRKLLLLVGVLGLPFTYIYTAPLDAYKFLSEPVPDIISVRKDLSQQVSLLNARVPDMSKKVYVVVQNTSGFESLIMRYLLLPRHSNNVCWSIARIPKDMWTCKASAEGIEANLKTYDYLLLIKTDAAFWQQFRFVFQNINSDRNKKLFRIDHFRSDKVRFVAI